MMKPQLKTAMTSHPHTIRLDETVVTARKMMAALDVRHLPVLKAGEIVGVISDRDLKLVNGEPGNVKVEDLCVDDPVTVDVDTSLFVVASVMADKRVGSVLVTDAGKLAGIFTTTDACRVLAGLLHPEEK
ncbi:MAG: CBS domain-containing protein [Deltaproteobacteria bacterium]|nr:CBS domain-containing protein [Deltaproteobacteria bacterium]